jgi:hypothetical protein
LGPSSPGKASDTSSPQPVHAQPPLSQVQTPQPPGEGHSVEELHPGSGAQVTPPLLPPELPLAPLELPLAPLELLLPPSVAPPGP